MALTREPDLAIAHYNLGMALKQKNKQDEANPSYAEALSMLGTFINLEGSRRALAEAASIQHEAVAKLADMLDRK